MKKATKQFERQKLRVRDKIERKGIVLAKSMIRAHYQYFLDKLKQVGINQYDRIEIPESITKGFFNTFYPMSSVLAVMEYEQLEKQAGKKAEPTDKQTILNSIFQNELTRIVNTTAAEKIESITATSKDAIRKAIRNVLDIADTEGWGIPEITSKIYKSVGDSLRGNGYARARAIAQTEMISASNQASTEAAEKTGLNYRKFWSTSGLPGIRASHIQAEEFSNSVDGLRPDQTFPNGLLYPGDPSGPAEEVINCRCTIMHEIII